ncbi:hypothetical protein FQN54_006297 [Arachnomyces sp. PD_36]|nr:hypothetical protein FQN54_006297 [Arachnomyces sp. PD_36]
MSHLTYYSYPGVGQQNLKKYSYSQAVRLGDRIECAGQGGWDPHTGEFYKEINAQIDQAFANVELNLQHAGGQGWEQVYRVNSYHVPINDEALGAMNLRQIAGDLNNYHSGALFYANNQYEFIAGTGEAAAPRPRMNRQQDQGNIESALRKNQLTALQGATLAFNNKAHTSKPSVPESRGGSRSPRRPGTPSNPKNGYASPESSPERHIGSVKDTIKKFTDNHGSTDTHRASGNNDISHHNKSETPQWIAAQLAAGRSATKSANAAPPPPAKRINALDRSQTARHNTSSPYSHENASTTSIQDIKSTKPARAASTRTRVGEPTSNSRDGFPPSNSTLDDNDSMRPRTPRRRSSLDASVKMTGSNLMRPSDAAAPSPGDPSKSPRHHLKSTPASHAEGVLSPKLTSGVILSPSPKREQPSPLLDRKPPLPNRTNTSNSNTSFSPIPTRLGDPTIPRATSVRSATSRSPSRPDVRSESTLFRIRSQNHSNASLKPQNTGMSDDSMAHAIAASSIASSRAPSPSRNQPPPPPPQRRARSRSLLHPHGSKSGDSRTPSPSKGLRETMRTHSKSDEEEDNPKKHSRRRIIKTHPHKHSEGDRKRWKDQISDNERKRYDGVWAANRGLWVPSSATPFNSKKPSSDKVLNLVVREIWSRSRLPPSELEQVWSLVDRQTDGTLAREEFVVGMWLIDQRLKGRKLPVKVSASIWESPVTDIVSSRVPHQDVREKNPAGRLGPFFEDTCASKGKQCSYLPSKRGGPRKKKTPAPSQESALPGVTSATPVPAVSDVQYGTWEPILVPNQQVDDSMFNQLDSLGMPAAGIKQLDFPVEVQSMFQEMFVPAQRDTSQTGMDVQAAPIEKKPIVRLYGSEEDILNAYYVFVHAYFPILPPPISAVTADLPIDSQGEASNSTSSKSNVPYEPASPLSLAISAILALVPHPRESNPSSAEAVLLRRSTAENFARAATERIDADSELVESATQPSQALQKPEPSITRKPLHPKTPLELEGILALLLLSIYEYAQRGNLVKMRSRAGQAYVMAMDMSLHALGSQNDEFSEARRRAWWMTFYCVCQGSIVSTTSPTILVNDSRFVTPYPRFLADSEGWSILLQAQEALVSATQFVIELNQCLKSRSNMAYIYDRMQKLNDWIETILKKANSTPAPLLSADNSYASESVAAQSVRCISRIKLCSARVKTHRFRAFSDIPIFIQRHCDLTAASGIEQDGKSSSQESTDQDMSKLSCSCSNLEMLPPTAKTEYMPSPSSSTSSTSLTTPLPSYFGPGFPFTTEYSAAVCLSSALTIAEMFHSLPLPSPSYQDSSFPQQPQNSESKPQSPLPRTMPSFACCAMQSSYAMLMLYYRARISQPQDPERAREWIVNGPIRKLQRGLELVIGAVRNYSIAFEALDGMRGECPLIFRAFITGTLNGD